MAKRSVTKEQKKKVRDFVKDYDTEFLTVVLTDDWTFKPATKYKGDRKSKYTLRGSQSGFFRYVKSGGTGTSWEIYGFREVPLPHIAVNMNKKTWWQTFLHEFKHYIDHKTGESDSMSRMEKERSANHFAITTSATKENTISFDKFEEILQEEKNEM